MLPLSDLNKYIVSIIQELNKVKTMSVLRKITLFKKLVVVMLSLSSMTVFAGDNQTGSSDITDQSQVEFFQQRFASLGLQVLKVVPADIDGLLEIQTSSGVLFSSPSGDHFIAGTLYQMDKEGGYIDVLAKRQSPINAKRIEQMRDQMIVYKAANESYVVTVFTDITCGYCVRLHSELKQYNDLGITIRYLAFPRQGATGPVAEQMAAIWCSADPKAALNDAKLNRASLAVGAVSPQCKQNIADQYQLGRELGISGTPAIFLPSGEMVGGYLPPQQLLQRLTQ
jgi:thiol:disulfide interchange protein DsbC